MAKTKNFRKLSNRAKRGWETRRANLRKIQVEGIDRRKVSKWYQKQLDLTIEREVKPRLEKKAKAARKKLERAVYETEIQKLQRENRNLKRRLKQAEKWEEIVKSPRAYIEKILDKTWDKYGRDGGPSVERTIKKLAKTFSWPESDLWHWYFSPTWTSR